MKTKVGFIGFGLIAGALAHALKESGRDYHITATSRHLEPVKAAVADGIVDVAAPAVDETFAQCDIILLCTPVITITEYLTKLKAIASPDCIITDVGSVKTIIHDASDVGMNPIVMDYHVHDKSVAAISHVPHLLSTALVHVVSDNDDEEKHMQLLAAGCFRDMSRVAASSPEMWEQICLTNSSAISNILEQYIEMLETIKDNIDKKTPGYVASLFEMSREYRNSLESRHPEH